MKRKKESWGEAVGNAAWARVVAPAPGDLRIVQALVNSHDLKTGKDELTSPRALADWLTRWHLVPVDTEVGKTELERTLAVRDGLRMLVGANRGGALDKQAVARLDAAAASVTLRVRFDASGAPRYEPAAGGFDGALARLLHVVTLARFEGLWRRLKLCDNERCRRAFYDASQNRAGRWCSMKSCGSIYKSRAFRRRNPGVTY